MKLEGYDTSQMREKHKKPIYPKINNMLCVEKTNVVDVWFWNNGKENGEDGEASEMGRERKRRKLRNIYLMPLRSKTRK